VKRKRAPAGVNHPERTRRESTRSTLRAARVGKGREEEVDLDAAADDGQALEPRPVAGRESLVGVGDRGLQRSGQREIVGRDREDETFLARMRSRLAARDESAQELRQHARIPAAPLPQDLREPQARGRMVEHARDECADGLRGERLEIEARESRAGFQAFRQLLEALGPARRDSGTLAEQEHRARSGELAGEVAEDVERVVAGPVHVVEEDEQRDRLRERGQQEPERRGDGQRRHALRVRIERARDGLRGLRRNELLEDRHLARPGRRKRREPQVALDEAQDRLRGPLLLELAGSDRRGRAAGRRSSARARRIR